MRSSDPIAGPKSGEDLQAVHANAMIHTSVLYAASLLPLAKSHDHLLSTACQAAQDRYVEASACLLLQVRARGWHWGVL